MRIKNDFFFASMVWIIFFILSNVISTVPTPSSTYSPTLNQRTNNILINGGADTCTLFGWSNSGTTYTNGWGVDLNYEYVHSGPCSFFTKETLIAQMNQSLSLTVGETYLVSLWALRNASCHPGTYVNVSISISTESLISITVPTLGGYSQYTTRFVATTSTEILAITGKTNCLLWLDDISVTQLIETENGLIAYFPFNGNANDESGYDHKTTVIGATLTADRFGNPNSAYHFTNHSHIRISDSALLDIGTSDYSITAWVKFDQLNGTMSIFSHGGSCSSVEGYSLYAINAQVHQGFICGSYCLIQGSASTLPSSGVWYFIATTMQRYGNAIIYINAVSNDIISNTNSCSLSLEYYAGDAYIGSNNFQAEQFYGSIDEVRIYLRALSAEDVIELYIDGISTETVQNHLVAYYPFSGDADDASGNGNHGVVYSAVPTADRFGNPSSSYHFNGSSYIEIMNGEAFNFIDDLSISVWINPSPNQVKFSTIVNKGIGTNNQIGGFNLQQNNAVNNSFCFQYLYAMWDASNAGCQYNVQTASSKWNHVTITKQGTRIVFYLNGIVTSVENDSSTAIILSSGNLPLLIGAANSDNSIPANGLVRYFNGIIDDIFLYNRTLCSAEVYWLYGIMAAVPTSRPSNQPTRQPTSQPTSRPTSHPTGIAENGTLNLVANPGAEKGSIIDWYDSGGVQSNGWSLDYPPYIPVHSGSYAFLTESTNAVLSQVLSLAIGVPYSFSVWIWPYEGCGNRSASELFVDINDENILSLEGLAGFKYVQYGASFTANRAASTLQITGNTNCELAIDDIFVRVIHSENIITNPGAEEGSMLGWTVSGPSVSNGWIADLNSTRSNSGSYSFVTESATMASMSQSLSISIGATYSISFWAECFNEGHSCMLFLMVGNNILLYLDNLAGISSNRNFTYCKTNFIVAKATETIRINGSITGGSGYLAIDDISVSVIPNLVNNGGVEAGSFLGWIASEEGASNGWETDPYGYPVSHSGGFSFVTESKGPATLIQNLSLVSGANYEVSLWAECTVICDLSVSLGNNILLSFSSISPSIREGPSRNIRQVFQLKLRMRF